MNTPEPTMQFVTPLSPRDVGFHVGREQLHALLPITFNFSYRQIDIVLTKDGIRTLVDVVIMIQHKQIYFPNFVQFKDLPISDVAQANERSYRN